MRSRHEQLEFNFEYPSKLWISVRVVRARTHEDAVDKVIDGEFESGHAICDKVIRMDKRLRQELEDADTRHGTAVLHTQNSNKEGAHVEHA